MSEIDINCIELKIDDKVLSGYDNDKVIDLGVY